MSVINVFYHWRDDKHQEIKKNKKIYSWNVRIRNFFDNIINELRQAQNSKALKIRSSATKSKQLSSQFLSELFITSIDRN